MLKINLGAGETRYPGFINLDISDEYNPELVDDITKLESIHHSNLKITERRFRSNNHSTSQRELKENHCPTLQRGLKGNHSPMQGLRGNGGSPCSPMQRGFRGNGGSPWLPLVPPFLKIINGYSL